MLRGWKRWTVEEDEKLLREYKLKGPTKLSKEMTNRTMYAITQRYRTLTQSNKLIKRIHETQIDKCPFCGSSRINKVNTWHGKVVEAYYCVNCLKEFLPNGELNPPLYADDNCGDTVIIRQFQEELVVEKQKESEAKKDELRQKM